ncbi:hypothetical protein E4K10_49355 [Streptomyces sp. T1317-0309]|nr:hypothetical protein E4K10_49355 [Streptomyces sp. T1317-0309]
MCALGCSAAWCSCWTPARESRRAANDGLLQHLRVGADSAIGVRFGAREDARVLGLLGSGGMAHSHIEALLTVRPLERVQVYSPTRSHRERFAARMRELHGLEVVAVDDPESAHHGADLVAGCTDAVGDVVLGHRLRPGTHVTCIGGRRTPTHEERFDVWLRLGSAKRAVVGARLGYRRRVRDLPCPPGGRRLGPPSARQRIAPAS